MSIRTSKPNAPSGASKEIEMRELNFMTMEELERRNYANGHVAMAQLMARLSEAETEVTEGAAEYEERIAELDNTIIDLENKISDLDAEIDELKIKLADYE